MWHTYDARHSYTVRYWTFLHRHTCGARHSYVSIGGWKIPARDPVDYTKDIMPKKEATLFRTESFVSIFSLRPPLPPLGHRGWVLVGTHEGRTAHSGDAAVTLVTL